ncbi:NAD(P)H dehydrogenase [Companilactobacillus sp. RD055328]|uniref:NAD(P)H-dependent oxidoreductase n=1 Tax=Companilactobacillus sp. RD055328 TaxID=2916634 RepID=UPI001FC80277|nr:NAD(P)H-dependent oxidoreductase [Companilactobacillus sp. RD055328]GKQ42776.1 NAD(P)H dehydrogenase [Companilactobacillus sp. RD055328]
MKTLVIVSHPDINESATQNFLKASFPLDEEVTWHEVVDDIDIEHERQLLIENERIILQFPLYWYTAPAALKKWMDEVLDGDFIFAGQKPLANKEFGIVVSTGISDKQFQAGGNEKFTISEMLKPFEMTANKLQMSYLRPLVINQFEYFTNEQKQALVVDYQCYLQQIDDNFDGRLNWFIKRLKDDGQDLLADTLLAKKNELNDLSWQVKTMREDDGEG